METQYEALRVMQLKDGTYSVPGRVIPGASAWPVVTIRALLGLGWIKPLPPIQAAPSPEPAQLEASAPEAHAPQAPEAATKPRTKKSKRQ